jgi:outer membrane protein OmpA-like peptidoglycan-associated protein
MVLKLLVAAGLDPSLVDVTSHGEADPLVPTPDERLEPRNRRVEITVR